MLEKEKKKTKKNKYTVEQAFVTAAKHLITTERFMTVLDEAIRLAALKGENGEELEGERERLTAEMKEKEYIDADVEKCCVGIKDEREIYILKLQRHLSTCELALHRRKQLLSGIKRICLNVKKDDTSKVNEIKRRLYDI